MIKFEDLELGKEYILIKKDKYLSLRYLKIKIIRKGKLIPVNYNHEILDNNGYDYVCYITNHDNDINTISAYRDEHLEFWFFDLNEDIENQLNDIIDNYREQELFKLNKKFEEDKQKVNEELNDFKNNILDLLPKQGQKSKKKRK